MMKVGVYSGIPLVFGLAFWRLFLHFGIADPVVWLSLAVPVTFLGFAILVHVDRALDYWIVGFLAVTDPRGDSMARST